jgi:hypothetical protein
LTAATNDDLARKIGSDLARLRRISSPAPDTRQPKAAEIVPDHQPPGEEPEEAATEAARQLSEMERRALFVALSAGTEHHLGRQPTVTEFVRLSDAVVLARQLAALEQGLFCGGIEVHWTGNEWVVQPVENGAR